MSKKYLTIGEHGLNYEILLKHPNVGDDFGVNGIFTSSEFYLSPTGKIRQIGGNTQGDEWDCEDSGYMIQNFDRTGEFVEMEPSE
jgi:hypothetical protein